MSYVVPTFLHLEKPTGKYKTLGNVLLLLFSIIPLYLIINLLYLVEIIAGISEYQEML